MLVLTLGEVIRENWQVYSILATVCAHPPWGARVPLFVWQKKVQVASSLEEHILNVDPKECQSINTKFQTYSSVNTLSLAQ